MKIAHVLNMANDGYSTVKALRKEGLDCDLIIDADDFGMGLPMWEDLEIEMDPYKFNFKEALKHYDLPDWIRIWEAKYKFTLLKISNLFRVVRGYDLLHCHVTSSVYLQFSGQPFMIYDAGWIRNLVNYTRSVGIELGQRSYREALGVTWTNPDTRDMVKSLNPKRMDYIPFVIDPEQYKPVKTEKSGSLLFFHPARQVWDVKGNDKLFYAFGTFVKNGFDARLRCIDWGYAEDVKAAKKLVNELGISDRVEWAKPMSKPRLIRAYSEADAVFDQFTIGGSGTTGLEAMSCGTPLCIYMTHWTADAFGEEPPVVNACSVNEIYDAMVLLTGENYRKKIGQQGQKYVNHHCNPKTVAKKLIKVYEEVLN